MKTDEFAFVNLQLAGMLRSGIPLEGALRQLCANMRRGALREELRLLETDLAAGRPLGEALEKRKLPALYRSMLLVGVQGGDMPGALVMIADYYQRISFLGTRLKGLLVYPAIVLLSSLGLSVFLALFLKTLTRDIPDILEDGLGSFRTVPKTSPDLMDAMIWAPVWLLGLLTVAVVAVLLAPPLRRFLRWHVPGFREAGLSQVASALSLMLRNGGSLPDALGVLRGMESRTPVGRDVASWQKRLAAGHARFPDMAVESRVVPPLFRWLVGSAGENLADGFQRAAEIYRDRAAYRVELMLYAALPMSVLFLGLVLASQAYPVVVMLIKAGSVMSSF